MVALNLNHKSENLVFFPITVRVLLDQRNFLALSVISKQLQANVVKEFLKGVVSTGRVGCLQVFYKVILVLYMCLAVRQRRGQVVPKGCYPTIKAWFSCNWSEQNLGKGVTIQTAKEKYRKINAPAYSVPQVPEYYLTDESFLQSVLKITYGLTFDRPVVTSPYFSTSLSVTCVFCKKGVEMTTDMSAVWLYTVRAGVSFLECGSNSEANSQ